HSLGISYSAFVRYARTVRVQWDTRDVVRRAQPHRADVVPLLPAIAAQRLLEAVVHPTLNLSKLKELRQLYRVTHQVDLERNKAQKQFDDAFNEPHEPATASLPAVVEELNQSLNSLGVIAPDDCWSAPGASRPGSPIPYPTS